MDSSKDITPAALALGPKPHHRIHWIALGLFLFALFPRAIYPLATSICYDETVAKDSGRIWDLLLAGDFGSKDWAQFPYFPYYRYLFGLIPQILFGAEPSDPFDLVGARWVGACLGSGIVVVTFFIGLRCLPFGAAVLGALLLALFPTALGHDRIASQDAPSRLVGLLAWWFLLRWSSRVRADGQNSLPSGLLWIAALFGICLTLYYRTGVANGLGAMLWLLILFRNILRKRHTWRILVCLFLGFVIVFIGTWIFSAWILWPYVWFRPSELFRWYADPLSVATTGGGVEYWFGLIRTLPHSYYLIVLLVCTPPITLLAFLGWHTWEGWRWLGLARRAQSEPALGRDWLMRTLPIWVMFWIPLILGSITLRQSLTHYLQILLPALCLGASGGIWLLHERIHCKRASWRRPSRLILLVTPIFAQAYACASVSPYFFEYFNGLTGGGANVTAKRLFAQGFYGEAILPLFDHMKTHGEPGSTVACRFGPWPGLSRLDRVLGSDFFLQGHQAIDPLGARYVLRAGYERYGEFYRYLPNPLLYEKVFDVMCDGGSLGDVWRRKEGLAAAGLVYADDFATPQFLRFAVAGQNFNLNPFSDGKLYAESGDRPASVLMRFPAALFAGKRSASIEADVQMREGEFRILAGKDPQRLHEVARASNMAGCLRGNEVAVRDGRDLFVALEWQSAHRWDGKPRTFWNSDWIDALRIYAK